MLSPTTLNVKYQTHFQTYLFAYPSTKDNIKDRSGENKNANNRYQAGIPPDYLNSAHLQASQGSCDPK